MRILIACEYSGIVREAFKNKGHDAWSCDLLPTEIEGNHYQGNVFDIINENWDLMIAHPPCTYLSNAGATSLFPKGILNEERYKLGLEGKDFFIKLLNANILKICVENPVPSKIFNLPPFSQIIQPYQFGHPFQKKTLLWLKNLPPLFSTNITEARESTRTARWFQLGGKNRRKNRAKFWTGIAEAMVDQWG